MSHLFSELQWELQYYIDIKIHLICLKKAYNIISATFSSPDTQTLHMQIKIKVKASAATGFQNKIFSIS